MAKINWDRINPQKEPDYSKVRLPPAWRKMKSKFGGKCAHCGTTIVPGEPIHWRKGVGARHSACHKSLVG